MTENFRIAALAAFSLGVAPLAGCSSQDSIESKDESAESVAAKVAGAGIRPNPGRWEAQFKIVKMDMPDMPPELQAMFKEQLGKVETSISCLTEEEAEKAEEDFFRPPETKGDECKYNSFDISGGKIEADMTCADGDATQNMKMSGTYGPDAYAMTVAADGNMGEQKMAMEMEIQSKRVGDCDGSEG
ncbi:MAG: DUF3617 domain-containing protein [Novosphingobium sp.]|nr:DUF3617 domain-containing protein [Novosphingobium sp.]